MIIIASRQKEHTELNCNVYSTMADTTIIIKVKGMYTKYELIFVHNIGNLESYQ
jgi:hypothetical protein